jgi:ABC-type sulfate/molybdate transport systems ATPase subunit
VVIFVTHDMEEAFRFCADLVVLDGGRVIASGPRQQLFEHPRTVATARLTGCKNIVPACRKSAEIITVQPWGCDLFFTDLAAGEMNHVGYRSHHFLFQQNATGKNTFPCWLVRTSEAPHEMTLYLRLHRPPEPDDPPHLQADVPKDVWRTLSTQPQPWQITFDPARLLLLKD